MVSHRGHLIFVIPPIKTKYKRSVAFPVYNMAMAATAAAPRPKNDCELRPDATLAVAWAGPDLVLLASGPPEVPEPLEGEIGVLPPEPPEPPEPGAWPGLKFSVAEAASATKASIVRLPDAGALIAPTMPAWQCFPCEQ